MTPLSPVLSISPSFCLLLRPCSLLLFVKTARQWAFVLRVRFQGDEVEVVGGGGCMAVSLRQGWEAETLGKRRGRVWCQTG